jgi:hypothetical protein
MLLLIQEIMKNLPEFKALIIRYETITIDEIKKKDCNLELLTGFGSCITCTLCKKVGYDKKSKEESCIYCVYYELNNWLRIFGMPCNTRENAETYNAICKAETPEELLKAYWLRAKHMRSILKKLNIEF